MKLAAGVAVFGLICCGSLYDGAVNGAKAPPAGERPFPPVILEINMIEVEKPKPLAVLNHNPLNVKARANDPWKGQVGVDAQGHAVFSSYEYGVRAASLVLRSYARKHRIDTVDGLVERFAEGNRDEYVRYLCRKLGVARGEKVDLVLRMPELLRHMARFESGVTLPDELFIPYDVIAKL